MSASSPAQSLLLDQRDVHGAKCHRRLLNPHQLPGSNDQHSESKIFLRVNTYLKGSVTLHTSLSSLLFAQSQ